MPRQKINPKNQNRNRRKPMESWETKTQNPATNINPNISINVKTKQPKKEKSGGRKIFDRAWKITTGSLTGGGILSIFAGEPAEAASIVIQKIIQ